MQSCLIVHSLTEEFRFFFNPKFYTFKKIDEALTFLSESFGPKDCDTPSSELIKGRCPECGVDFPQLGCEHLFKRSGTLNPHPGAQPLSAVQLQLMACR